MWTFWTYATYMFFIASSDVLWFPYFCKSFVNRLSSLKLPLEKNFRRSQSYPKLTRIYIVDYFSEILFFQFFYCYIYELCVLTTSNIHSSLCRNSNLTLEKMNSNPIAFALLIYSVWMCLFEINREFFCIFSAFDWSLCKFYEFIQNAQRSERITQQKNGLNLPEIWLKHATTRFISMFFSVDLFIHLNCSMHKRCKQVVICICVKCEWFLLFYFYFIHFVQSFT